MYFEKVEDEENQPEDPYANAFMNNEIPDANKNEEVNSPLEEDKKEEETQE